MKRECAVCKTAFEVIVRGGGQPKCCSKQCSRIRAREITNSWCEKNYDRVKELRNKSLSRTSEKVMLYQSRHRAKRDSLEHSITLLDITIPETCPILGTAISPRGGDGSPSLDRIRNDIGYVPGNVQVVSTRANALKRDATLDELVLLGKWAASVLAEQLAKKSAA